MKYYLVGLTNRLSLKEYKMKRTFTCLFLFVLLSASNALPQSSPPRYQVPVARNDGWKTAAADSLDVDSHRLALLTQSIRSWRELGVHAILIERRGQLIYEEYFEGFDERWGSPLGKISMTAESKHDLRSVTKSVVSALVGIAHGEGTIPSLDQPVIEWFPEYPELNTPDRRRVTLAHVLRSEEHTSELQSLAYLVCRLLLEKKKTGTTYVAGNWRMAASLSVSPRCCPSQFVGLRLVSLPSCPAIFRLLGFRATYTMFRYCRR